MHGMLVAYIVSQLGKMICLTQEALVSEIQGISRWATFNPISDDIILSIYY